MGRQRIRPAPEGAFSGLWNELAGDAAVLFRVLVTGQPKALKPATQEQIFLICREALINALRHSGATCIEAQVEYLPRRLRIFVRDNGCGMDQKMFRSGVHAHRGLLGMCECADGIGAQLWIWSRPGAGTEVELSIRGRKLAEASE